MARKPKVTRYELWHSPSENSYSMFGANDDRSRHLLEKDAVLLTTFDATSWEDACRQQHEYLGWEPYRPLDPD